MYDIAPFNRQLQRGVGILVDVASGCFMVGGRERRGTVWVWNIFPPKIFGCYHYLSVVKLC